MDRILGIFPDIFYFPLIVYLGKLKALNRSLPVIIWLLGRLQHIHVLWNDKLSSSLEIVLITRSNLMMCQKGINFRESVDNRFYRKSKINRKQIIQPFNLNWINASDKLICCDMEGKLRRVAFCEGTGSYVWRCVMKHRQELHIEFSKLSLQWIY